MRYFLQSGTMLLLSAGLAFAQTSAVPPSSSAAAPVTTPPSLTEPPHTVMPMQQHIGPADRRFADMAAASGIGEVQAGQLAESKSDSASVKEFAARMVADHTKANEQLMQLASAENIPIPSEPDTSDAATLRKLQTLNGQQFNHWYIRTQVQDHVKAIALFKTEAASGEDSRLKQFAQATLPILQMHLRMARNLSGHAGAQG